MRVNVQRVSDVVATQLEQRILEGSLKPGDRLPAERELAAELGVSRPSLREAIQKLVSKGMLVSRQGGGTFVTDRLSASFVDPWKLMVEQHPDLQGDLLEFRHMLEARAAELAARRATEADRRRLAAAHERVAAAFAGDDPREQAEADVDFHQAIAEASHNIFFGQLMASLFRLLREHIDRNLGQLTRSRASMAALAEQHRAVWDAIRSGDSAAAGMAAREHIDFVIDSMMENARIEARQSAALRRLNEV